MYKLKVLFTILSFFVVSVFASSHAQAQQQSWDSWLGELKQEVISRGIKPDLADRALLPLKPDPKVLKQDQNQAPKKYSFAEYKKKAVNPVRIKNGQQFYHKHYKDIEHFAEKEGVPGPVIVALLGIETDFGQYTGDFDVLRSVITLAYGTKRDTKAAENSRKKYFREQAYWSLKMLQDGLVKPSEFKGSWAGAFGINQHMPESFYTYVVDGDQDGDREILNHHDLSDVFATTAKHLHDVGWKPGQKWGRAVKLPQHCSKNLVGNKIVKPLSFWRKMGVALPNGDPLPHAAGMKGSIIAPDGLKGPVYIGYDNFHAFRKWNKSDYFALVVGLLSDNIAAQ